MAWLCDTRLPRCLCRRDLAWNCGVDLAGICVRRNAVLGPPQAREDHGGIRVGVGVTPPVRIRGVGPAALAARPSVIHPTPAASYSSAPRAAASVAAAGRRAPPAPPAAAARRRRIRQKVEVVQERQRLGQRLGRGGGALHVSWEPRCPFSERGGRHPLRETDGVSIHPGAPGRQERIPQGCSGARGCYGCCGCCGCCGFQRGA